jgi:hypothetical protein
MLASWPQHERTAFLKAVCDALRRGMLADARLRLLSVGARGEHDAAWLNLMGLLHECEGQSRIAHRFYGRAMRADRHYRPAEQNMRRLYELHALGRTYQVPVLGDEPPSLLQLLSECDAPGGRPVVQSAGHVR